MRHRGQNLLCTNAHLHSCHLLLGFVTSVRYTSQEIGLKERRPRLRNELFCVELNVKTLTQLEMRGNA